MFKYFLSNKLSDSFPIKKYSKFDYIKTRYTQEIDKLKDYYANRNRAVNNSHILARLLDVVCPNYNLEIVEYFKIVNSSAKYVSKQFNITSNINIGEIHDNIMYKGLTYESLLYVEKDYDIFEIGTTWKSKTPLKVIYSSHTIIDMHIPERFSDYEGRLTIYEIDLIEMALQYKYWCLERNDNDMSTDSTYFVSTVLQPSLIGQIVDFSIFNRFISLSNGNKLSTDVKHNHPFNILNYTKGIDQVLNGIIKDVSDEKIPLDQILGSIPAIVKDNMKEVLSIDHKYYNTQSEWLLWLSRTKIILSLLNIMGDKGRKRNLDWVTRLPTIIKIIERRASKIDTILPVMLQIEFNENIEKIKMIVGKR